MMLLTKENREDLPPLYSTENQGDEAVIQVKFFTPDSHWTWYATEFDGEDTFFGLVHGQHQEFGYFSLTELQTVRGPMGMSVERDMYFGKKTIGEVRKRGYYRPLVRRHVQSRERGDV